MKKSTLFLLAGLLTFTGLSLLHAQSTDINGYVRNYTGVLADSGDYAIIQNTVDLTFSGSMPRGAWVVNPKIYQYPNQQLNLAFTQAYMDLYFDKFDVRLGKQQIIWGKSDGVFITDVVTPKDLSEFLLRDFDEIRMGITALKVNYFMGQKTLEWVWVPTFTPTTLPAAGTIWDARPTFPVPVTWDLSGNTVSANLENSETFLRLASLGSRLDYTVMAGYMWDDDPTPHLIRQIDPVTHQLTGLTVTPQHHRLSVFGGGFSTGISGMVLRGEAAYYQGKYLVTNDPADMDGVTERDYLHYLVGWDFSLGGANLSTQFMQQFIPDHDPNLNQAEFTNTATFLANHTFFRETLITQLFVYYGLEEGDALWRPSVTYDLGDGISLLLGANWFTGSAGVFGQFDANDMAYVKVKYSF